MLHKLIGHILEAADKSQPEWEDIELSLVRIIARKKQLETDLKTEKQKHLDTSNWALEQQDRADQLEEEHNAVIDSLYRQHGWGKGLAELHLAGLIEERRKALGDKS